MTDQPMPPAQPLQPGQPSQPDPAMYMQENAPDPKQMKTGLTITALILTVIATALIIVSAWVIASGLKVDMKDLAATLAAAQAADGTRLVFMAVAGLLNLVAFIIAIIAIVKSRAKLFPIIVLVVVIILPGIGMYINNVILSNALEALTKGL